MDKSKQKSFNAKSVSDDWSFYERVRLRRDMTEKDCIDGKMVPNYPLESYGIFIKIVNVFQDLVRILGMRKLTRGGLRLRR